MLQHEHRNLLSHFKVATDVGIIKVKVNLREWAAQIHLEWSQISVYFDEVDRTAVRYYIIGFRLGIKV